MRDKAVPLSPISESSSGVCHNVYARSVSAGVSDESVTGSDSGVFETTANNVLSHTYVSLQLSTAFFLLLIIW